jgi:transcription initiation factor IIE alpha subunit
MRYNGSAKHSALRTKSQEKRIRDERQATGALGASSSVNLEKAYEELEKEIMEIKSKLQKSITNDDESSNYMGNSQGNSQYKYQNKDQRH